MCGRENTTWKIDFKLSESVQHSTLNAQYHFKLRRSPGLSKLSHEMPVNHEWSCYLHANTLRVKAIWSTYHIHSKCTRVVNSLLQGLRYGARVYRLIERSYVLCNSTVSGECLDHNGQATCHVGH